MQRGGRSTDPAGDGVATRVADGDPAPFTRSKAPPGVRHDPDADVAAQRLAELCDQGRPLATRCDIAVMLSHELDMIFTQISRLPRARLHDLVTRYDEVVHEDLLPHLATAGVTFPGWDELERLEREQIRHHFHQRALPLFTPMAVDSTHPLPHLPSLALNVGILVEGRLVLVTMSPHLPRLLTVRRGRHLTGESVVGALLPHLLVGVAVAEYTTFRVTRSAETGLMTRLEVERGAGARLVHTIATRLQVADADVYPVRSSLAMGDALDVSRWTASRTEKGA